MLRTLLVVAAGVTAATVALAQSEPGAGAPAAPHGEPYAPNGSIAPSAMPSGGAMGTKANTLSNPVPASDDADRGTTAKTGSHRHRMNGTSVGGMSDRAPGHYSDPAAAPEAGSTPPR